MYSILHIPTGQTIYYFNVCLYNGTQEPFYDFYFEEERQDSFRSNEYKKEIKSKKEADYIFLELTKRLEDEKNSSSDDPDYGGYFFPSTNKPEFNINEFELVKIK